MVHHGLGFPLAYIWRYCALGFFAALGLGVVLGIVGLRDGSFLYGKTRGEMIFRKRLSQRTFLIVMGVVLILGPLFPFLSDLSGSPTERRQALTAGRLGVTASFALVGILVGGLMFWISRPEELRLDQERRTYHLARGWPVSRASSGTWEDLAGVAVRSVGQSGYEIEIAWKRGRGHRVALGRFGRQKLADEFAAELSAALDLPRVTPPLRW